MSSGSKPRDTDTEEARSSKATDGLTGACATKPQTAVALQEGKAFQNKIMTSVTCPEANQVSGVS